MENGEIKIRQEPVEEMQNLKDVIKEVKEMIVERAAEVEAVLMSLKVKNKFRLLVVKASPLRWKTMR